MRRLPSALALVLAVALMGSACASRKDTGFPALVRETSASPTPTEGEGPVELTGPVDVIDNEFGPEDGIVTAGTKVVWAQSGSAPHTVTADPGQGVEFDSHPDCLTKQKCMLQGDSFEFTFDKAGSYKYYCRVHGGPGGAGMAATIEVK